MNEITDLIYLYDDITRSYQVILQNSCEKDFLAYVEHVDGLLLKLTETRNECKRLKTALDAANKDITVLDSKLTSARRWLDAERQQRKKLENEKDSLSLIFDELRRLINNPGNKVPDETREKISSISKTLDIPSNIYRTPYDRLNTIAELESTSSNLSDVSISRSEDDILDDTRLNTRKHRPSYLDDEPISVKRRSGVVPPFTPTAPRVESLESSDSEYFVDEKLNANKENQSALISPFDRLYTRTHTFVEPSFFTAEYCSICEKTRLRRKNVRRCTDCNVVAHQECCEKVPLPCIPLCAPSKSGATGTIEDYAPLISPMVPALIVHSILEVERRRFKDMAIYKMPSTEKDVSTLKKKFLKCKGAPSLSNVDIHTICCCVKSFLKFDLRDTLIPKSKWYTFSKIILESNKVEKLCQAISSLPQANRDTLVFLILHLQKVAMSPDCKMSASDLANIFGPLLIEPFASEEVEASHSDKIVAELLKLPSERLIRLVTEPSTIPGTPYTLCHTPSTESLLRKTSRKFLTTPGGRRRFFNTPPFSK